MTYRLISPLLSSLLLFILNLPAKSQDSVKFQFSPQTAHPNAQALMKEDFFWSPIDDAGPFGTDRGSDAAYGYYHWQKTHEGLSPVTYLKSLTSSWKYPEIDSQKNAPHLPTYLSKNSHVLSI